MSPHTIVGRLHALRQALVRHHLMGVLIPSSDPHLSEYLPTHWQGREWASGFTGSMGTLVILQHQAALFTDSRYWTQAQQELGHSGIELIKMGSPGAMGHAEWVIAHATQPGVLAVDGRVLDLNSYQDLQRKFEHTPISLRTDIDVLDEVWLDRPPLSIAPITEHLPPHAVISRSDKLSLVRTAMQRLNATHHALSSTEDIAWLLNLRGRDVDYNPVFMAHALVTPEAAHVFIDERKVPPAIAANLAKDHVSIHAYTAFATTLSQLPHHAQVLIDPRRTTVAHRQAIGTACQVIEHLNPTVPLKSRKTEAEAAYVREAMARDGAAMAAFYAWFEQSLGRSLMTELTVDERLTLERSRQPEFVSLSFPTIAGFNANGAMPHYQASLQKHSTISTPEGIPTPGLLLIDSGAQYLGGTTDITRVWPIGETSPAQRRDFTLVLKAMIQLSQARFPTGTLSPMLDALARAPLWQHGLDFGHGTGHGVGYFLNVHEGPQSISKAIPTPHMAMQPGMITSNEPGLYRPGLWGIRIENLLLNIPSPQQEMGEFLAFETLTLCPIDTRCIDKALMREDEIRWLNDYHAQVWERVSPLTRGDAKAWLEARTRALSMG